MARDGAGNWIPLAPVVGGTVITSSWANNMMTSFGADVTESLDRSGRGGMLVPFRIADGTKAEPGYSWTAELSTGFYRDLGGANMRVSITGTDIFRWNGSGAQISPDDGASWNAVLTDGGAGGVAAGTADGQTLYWDETTDKNWKATSVFLVDTIGNGAGVTGAGSLSVGAGTAFELTLANTAGNFLNSFDRIAMEYVHFDYFADSHLFKTGIAGATDAMVITSAGNVGIGTTTPSVMLDVQSGAFAGTVRMGADSGANTLTDATTKIARVTSPHYSNAAAPVAVIGVQNGASTNVVSVGGNLGGSVNAATTVNFFTAADTTTALGTERMRIDSAGAVGIGTITPYTDTLLHISDTAAAAVGKGLTIENRSSDVGTTARLAFRPNTQDPASFDRGAFIDAINTVAGNATDLAFSTSAASANPAEHMRIAATGKVGIGIAPSTDFKLFVNGDVMQPWGAVGDGGAGVARMGGQETTNDGMWIETHTSDRSLRLIARANTGDPATAPILFYTSNIATIVERMRLDSLGNLNVGTVGIPISTDATLFADAIPRIDVVTGTSTGVDYEDCMVLRHQNTGSGTDLRRVGLLLKLSNDNSAGESQKMGGIYAESVAAFSNTPSLCFATLNTERMRITSAGSLFFGQSTGTAGGAGGITFSQATFGRSILQAGLDTAVGATLQRITQWYHVSSEVGSIQINDISTSYVTSSDARLKDNIVDAGSALAVVDGVQVRQFDWNVGRHQDFGFVAQELVNVYPDAVSVGDEDNGWGVDNSKLVPLLTAAIQELTARLELLEGVVNP